MQNYSRQTKMKHSGQVFTPTNIVKMMLDLCEYFGEHVRCCHIMENSCGNGAFLEEIVRRYCTNYLKNNSNKDILRHELQTYIHGIESDKSVYYECLGRLDKTAADFDIHFVQWDVKLQNALEVSDYDGKMDFVVGNPPYVRVHNLKQSYHQVKQFHFTQGGMTDLYLAFFELGFRMLKPDGKLVYITPNSWLSSLAAQNMRQYILETGKLAALVDMQHYQAFEKATTYTLVSFFDRSKSHNKVKYYTFDPIDNEKVFVENLSYGDFSIDGQFFLARRGQLQELRAIKSNGYPQKVFVKNGFATLADKIFIGNFPFSQYIIPTLKASTGKWQKAFFPYDSQGKPIDLQEIFSHKAVANYLQDNKQTLLKGKTEQQNPQWYLYGRTQALKDVYSDKTAVNTIVKDIECVKVNFVPKGCGLYSGLYIMGNVPFEIIENHLKSNEFIEYLTLLRNYKSGGYYTFGSRDLQQYLNYKLFQHKQPFPHIS